MNPKVDEYLSKVQKWQEELTKLRAIVLDCHLTEELKWRQPCYTFQNSNVLLIAGFKEYCTISFFKGVLLHDGEGVLHQPGENSQFVRMMKFTSVDEIIAMEPTIKAYIYEAIEVEKAGLKVEVKTNDTLVLPEELQIKLDEDPALKTAFHALTPGRQRGYVIFISAAKQSKSREARVEKHRQRILDGKGINDCICGFSRKMPNCDGSHKYAKV